MSVYSTDVRRLVMARVERGEAVGDVAERFGISTKTIRRWLARQRQGRLEPDRCGPKGPVKLTPADDQVLREALRQQPGLTLNQLRGLLSVQVVESTIHRRLNKLHISFKKSR